MSDLDISVIIPCYNAEQWVAKAIDSVLMQVGVSVELIVVDDGSSDESLTVLKRYGNSIRLKTGPNRGACAARSSGLALARADYVMFLDADDFLEGPFLAQGVAAMRAVEASVGFGPQQKRNAADAPIILPPEAPDHLRAIDYCIRHHPNPASILWRRSFVEEIGGWDIGLQQDQDLELNMRALSHKPVVATWQGGIGVYLQVERPSRISLGKITADRLRARRNVFNRCASYLVTAGWTKAEAKEYFLGRTYDLYRDAAKNRERGIERAAKKVWEDVAETRHHGSPLHRFTAGLFGLRRKEMLSKFLHGVRARARF